MTIALLAVGAAGLALLISCLCDLRRFEIPDSLSIVILLAACTFGFATPGFDWLWHLAGLGVNAIELMPVHEFNELEYYQVATALCTAGQQGRAGGGRARL